MSSSNVDNTIAYIGDDPDFIIEIEEHFKKLRSDRNRYIKKSYYPGVILNVALTEMPSIIIFESPQLITNILHEELCFFKKISAFKPIMLVGIFPDKEVLEKAETLISCGLSLCYIKGCELEHLFRDCQLYGFENKIISPSFAKAANLKIKRKLNVISTIAGITGDELFIDTDVSQDDNANIRINIPFFKDSEFRNFEIIKHFSHGLNSPSTDSYKIQYPFAGPWDEMTNEKLQPDLVSTRIEEYSDNLDLNKNYIWIFSATHLVEKVFLHSLSNPVTTEFKTLDNLDYLNEVENKLPSTYFIELESSEVYTEQEDSLIISLLDQIKKIRDYNPVVFILNSKTSSHQFQVQNKYNNIICSPRQLDFDFFAIVVSKIANKGYPSIHPFMTFKKDDVNRMLVTDYDILILSLTEHEIEFEFASEISLFSIAQIMLPGKILVLIVQSSKIDENKWRYTGILHGMDDLAYQYLRKIINQLIFNPKNELSKEEINLILFNPAPCKVKLEPEESSATSQTTIKNITTEKTFVRPKKAAKSKL